VGGHDTATDYRAARSLIGLVPQEVNLEPFEKVINTVRFSRGLFGKPRDEALIERVLRQLSLWDKRDSQIRALSGGMKRRVLIAKALAMSRGCCSSTSPRRASTWSCAATCGRSCAAAGRRRHDHPDDPLPRRGGGDGRPGRRDHQGAPLLVEEKAALMTRLGRKELVIELRAAARGGARGAGTAWLQLMDGHRLVYTYDTQAERTGITRLLADIQAAGLHLSDVETRSSSLEEIFVDLVAADMEDSDMNLRASRRSTGSRWAGPSARWGNRWCRRC
jgi:ABC-2 type transport system ATP-binding protein